MNGDGRAVDWFEVVLTRGGSVELDGGEGTVDECRAVVERALVNGTVLQGYRVGTAEYLTVPAREIAYVALHFFYGDGDGR